MILLLCFISYPAKDSPFCTKFEEAENGKFEAVDGSKASGFGVIDVGTGGVVDVRPDSGGANGFFQAIIALPAIFLLLLALSSFFFLCNWRA